MMQPSAAQTPQPLQKDRRPFLGSAVPIAALVLLAGCGDNDSMTGPDLGPSVQLTNAIELGEMLDDSQKRIIPFLKEGTRRDALAASLENLSWAIARGNVVPLRDALVIASDAIDRFSEVIGDDGGALAEIDAMRISLDVISTQVLAEVGVK